MKNNKSTSLFAKEQVIESLKQSFVKLDPRKMIKNPIMFTVEVVTLAMFAVCIWSIWDETQGSVWYNFAVFIILSLHQQTRRSFFPGLAEAVCLRFSAGLCNRFREIREQQGDEKDDEHSEIVPD